MYEHTKGILGLMLKAGMVLAIVVAIASGLTLDRYLLRECDRLMAGGHVLIDDHGAISPGYILLSPYYSGNFNAAPGRVSLLDNYGRVVHGWKTRYQTLYSILEPNGHLFVAMTPPINQQAYPGGGTTGEIQELDWNGNVLWQYDDSEMTHDFEVLPDGDIAYTKWEQAPQRFAAQVRGGMQSATSSVWTDGIVIVNKDKQIVWQWHMYEHLDPSEYELNAYTPRSDWAHLNSIRYTSDNPITHVPAFLISVRHISTIFLIDAKNGEIIWHSPQGMLSMQHDATLLDNGDILAFDNGLFRPQSQPYMYSKVVEIDPETNKVVWQYSAGNTGAEQVQFASSIMGGAQRLSNGNTLITDSGGDRLLEVTPDKRIVWEYFNENRNEQGEPGIIFKARIYDPTGTSWASRVQSTSLVCHLYSF